MWADFHFLRPLWLLLILLIPILYLAFRQLRMATADGPGLFRPACSRP